ncbi:hypothetical protein CUMW_181540 [Citrus unshiu]|uniref:Uncharacterized protein n=1 Tax=Citrus unshiu TaxID=55188 RepID=A0A2H5PZF8_CITUN|nr:hypothetical protein CUMW_181540 [Citrus unshiu]
MDVLIIFLTPRTDLDLYERNEWARFEEIKESAPDTQSFNIRSKVFKKPRRVSTKRLSEVVIDWLNGP